MLTPTPVATLSAEGATTSLRNGPSPTEIQSTGQSGVKPPKLQLPTFDDRLSSLQPFWECFKKSVHESKGQLKTERLYFWKMLLTGAAVISIKGLQATEGCYEDTIEILLRWFGDKRRIEQELLVRLRSLPYANLSKDVQGLCLLCGHAQSHIRGPQ